eukprot:scaffold7346_cov245-Pinguiococcus_pyrenoidosus.AAC.35
MEFPSGISGKKRMRRGVRTSHPTAAGLTAALPGIGITWALCGTFDIINACKGNPSSAASRTASNIGSAASLPKTGTGAVPSVVFPGPMRRRKPKGGDPEDETSPKSRPTPKTGVRRMSSRQRIMSRPDQAASTSTLPLAVLGRTKGRCFKLLTPAA